MKETVINLAAKYDQESAKVYRIWKSLSEKDKKNIADFADNLQQEGDTTEILSSVLLCWAIAGMRMRQLTESKET